MTGGKSPEMHLTFGEFRIDPNDERLWGPNGPVRLGNKAFLVLSRLIEQQGRLVTKDDLFSSVWDGTFVSESALTSVMKELRRSLGDDSKQPRFIQSVYGRGYRFIEPVHEQAHVKGDAGDSSLTGARRRPAEGAGAHPPLLYVPAFDDAQLSHSHPWLSAVIREEVLLALSRFRDIRLVSDTAVKHAPAIAQPYGGRDYQLGIRLSNDGSSIRFFVTVVRLETQEIIWADRDRFDLGKLGQEIDLLTRKIVAAALPRLQEDVTRHLPAQIEDAFGIYLQTKLSMRAAETLQEMRAVAGEWEKLIATHPTFTSAYAPLITLYNTDYGYTGLGSTTDADRARAYALARKAARLDPSEPSLHTVAAWCHLWAGEAALAREHLNQALELNPFLRDRLIQVSTALMFLGDLDRAAELLARCETLTPFQTEAPYEEAGLLHLLQGHHEKALESLSRISQPTISSQLYALLAAGASGAPDLALQAREWIIQAQHRWHGSSPPEAAALSKWVSYHHPFQQPDQREWVLQVFERALSAAPQEPTRTLRPALRKDSSAP